MNRVEPAAFLLSLALIAAGAWFAWGVGVAAFSVGVALFVDLALPDKPAPPPRRARPKSVLDERGPRSIGGEE